MKRIIRLATFAVLITLVLAGLGWSGALTSSAAAPAQAVTPTPVAPLQSGGMADALNALQATLVNIYAQVNPSVVNIQVVQKQAAAGAELPDFGFPWFPFLEPQTPGQPREYLQRALGSGFVWDTAGHIVTNNHVVAGADKITVTFYDGMTVPAQLVGTDPDSDLAVIKVDVAADELRPIQVADSTQVKVGQLAVAIGNPFGLEGTMTVGFVSAVGRSLPVGSDDGQTTGYIIPDVIQTDAPINPGNSGGVLVNDQARLIGVPTAIQSPVRASAGIGFAVPSAIVRKVVPVLIEAGHYDHPWLGISGTTLSPDLAKAMGLEANQRGALVVDVLPDSPAAKAGLRGSDRQVTIEDQTARVGGDVIVAIEGQPVKKFDDVVTYLARFTEVGQTINLTVLRGGVQESVQVTLAARPTSQGESAKASVPGPSAGGAWLGILGQTLTPDIARAMQLPDDQKGVLIQQVEQGSPADKAGLRGSYIPVVINGQRVLVGGDVIVAIDGQPMESIQQVRAFVQQAKPGQQVTLTILRSGGSMDVPVTLEARPSQ
jgi:serine protease Do